MTEKILQTVPTLTNKMAAHLGGLRLLSIYSYNFDVSLITVTNTENVYVSFSVPGTVLSALA